MDREVRFFPSTICFFSEQLHGDFVNLRNFQINLKLWIENNSKQIKESLSTLPVYKGKINKHCRKENHKLQKIKMKKENSAKSKIQ